MTYLQKEVSNTFIAAAGSQHQSRLSLVVPQIDVDSGFQQQVHYVVMTYRVNGKGSYLHFLSYARTTQNFFEVINFSEKTTPHQIWSLKL